MKYILCLNGGGIRGTVSITFLKLLEKELGELLHTKFDMFAGTSTGGILALGLGGMLYSTSKVSKIYSKKNADKIMNKSYWDTILPIQDQPIYDGKGKTKLLKIYMKKKLLFDETNKFLVIPTFDIIKNSIKIFKNTNQKYELDLPLYEIGDATSAAPVYFPTVHTSKDNWLIDGGVVMNDPTMCAITEAIKIWPDEFRERKIKVITIGTGNVCNNISPEMAIQSRNWGAIQWLCKGNLLDTVMNQSNVTKQAERILGKDNYIYVNSKLKDCSEKMDDTSIENINNLKKLGKYWFKIYGEKVLNMIKE